MTVLLLPPRSVGERFRRVAPASTLGQTSPLPLPASRRLVITLAQILFIVGDIAGNAHRLRKARAEAAAFGAGLVMTPESGGGGAIGGREDQANGDLGASCENRRASP